MQKVHGALVAAVTLALLLFLIPAATGQDGGDLLRSFVGFLHTQDIAIDSVPDLYPGGYARISLRARNAKLGGMLVDDVWVRLVGVSLDPSALQHGQLRVLDYRNTAIHGQVGVRRLQDFFTSGGAFTDLRLWADGTSLFGEGVLPYQGASIQVWLQGYFALSGSQDVSFHIVNMRVNGFPLFDPIIRTLESQITPVLTQRDWPVTFAFRSLQMTKEGFVLSSQPDALAPCAFCLRTEGPAGNP